MRLDKVKVETPVGSYTYPVSIFSGLIKKIASIVVKLV